MRTDQNRGELAASEAAVAGRTTERLRAQAGAAAFGAVLVTAFLPHPVAFSRQAVLIVTAVLMVLMPLLRGKLDALWQKVGPFLSLGYVLAVVLLTGGTESIYHDLALVVVAMTALTRTLRMTAAVTLSAIALTVGPGVLAGATGEYYTDALLDASVMLTVVALMYQQSAGLRRQAAALEVEAAETHRLLDREHDVVEQLRQIQEARTTFGRSLSHEIRTPMTVLSGSLALLDDGDVPPERVASLVPAMNRAYARLQELLTSVERIYDTSEVSATRSPHAVGTLVHTAISRSPLSADRIDVHVGDQVGDVDGEMVVDALVRLLRNVDKHAPGARVRIDAELVDDVLELTVCDDGPGWDRDDPSELVEAFVQGRASASSHEPGVGVGLALVNAVVQAHGGEVRLSADDRTGGAVVQLLLPDARPAVRAEVG